MHMVFGDLTTRLHARLNGEGDVLGTFVFGRGADFVNNLGRDEKEHRKELISSLQSTGHVVCNTFFQKDSKLTDSNHMNTNKKQASDKDAPCRHIYF